MADTLRRMLESGKLTDEQCLSMLRGLNLDEEAGGCTSEITPVRADNRKPLLELLEIRKLSHEDKYLVYGQSNDEEDDINYICQIAESQGFDFEPDVRIPRLFGISPFYFGENDEQVPIEMVLYGRLGVHWFNFQENRNLKFIRIPKLNTEHPFSSNYFISVEVKDVDTADSSPSLILQTMVERPCFPELNLYMYRSRIKPTTAKSDSQYHYFHVNVVDEFYRGCMPTFLSKPPEEADDALRFYEVQEKDIEKNDWLRLYTEFALFQVCEAGSHAFLPEEMVMKKILVETLETHNEPSLKLKSMNAIFHISFRANSCDYTSVVRRTTDEISGHMYLEVDSRKETYDCFSQQVPSRT